MLNQQKTFTRRWHKALLCAISAAFVLCLGMQSASAQEPRDPDADKAGRVMLNARGGVAFGLYNTTRDTRFLGAAGIDLGVALSSDYNAYLILTPQVDLVRDLYNVMVPLGFQYDIRLTRHLFIYPRLSLGYAAFISNTSFELGSIRFSANQVMHGGVVIPELGIKFVINKRFNIGLEPLSIPIFFNGEDFAAWYRVMGFLGFNL